MFSQWFVCPILYKRGAYFLGHLPWHYALIFRVISGFTIFESFSQTHFSIPHWTDR
jgi:hypothetical protein